MKPHHPSANPVKLKTPILRGVSTGMRIWSGPPFRPCRCSLLPAASLPQYLLGRPPCFRREILDTATELFYKKGFSHTSISDIAQKAGISQGLCYRYFPSKKAIADAVSQTIALAILLVYLAKKRLFVCHIRQFDRALLPLCQSALPSVAQQGIPALSTALFTGLVSGFGVSAIAGYGVACKLEIILLYPAVSLNTALTAIVGQCVGAGERGRAGDYLRAALLFGGSLLVLLTAAVLLFARPLAGLFLPGEEVATLAVRYLLVAGAGDPCNGLASCFLGAVNGAGRPGTGMWLTALHHLGVRIPLAWLANALGLGLAGIWLSLPVSHLAAAVSARFAARRALCKAPPQSL